MNMSASVRQLPSSTILTETFRAYVRIYIQHSVQALRACVFGGGSCQRKIARLLISDKDVC